ncbi:MAG TPA: D-glycerate dehydrogenase [Candidatus Polarisedimenticolia bacterium]|nr:D-glycerate dehydrogenase [Candidatus Polarisedimenticolia bacterium]
MKVSILSTRRLFPEAEALVRRSFRVVSDPALAEGALIQLTDRVSAPFMDRMPRLRVISQCAAGVDNIDLAAARSRGVAVMNTPGVLTEATADMTWALILAVARRLVEADVLCRKGRYAGWDLEFMLGRDLSGATLGLIGPGRIARAVARRAGAFRMNVIYCGRRRHRRPLSPGAKQVGLDTLLRRADVVSLHVPATPDTRHLIGARELALMKRGAILVNTSRGSAVDETRLCRALERGRLGGAGLDVFEHEPRIPACLRRLDNVVLTPHIASATRRTRGAMAMTAAANLVEFFEGRPRPGHMVVRPAGGLSRRASGNRR